MIHVQQTFLVEEPGGVLARWTAPNRGNNRFFDICVEIRRAAPDAASMQAVSHQCNSLVAAHDIQCLEIALLLSCRRKYSLKIIRVHQKGQGLILQIGNARDAFSPFLGFAQRGKQHAGKDSDDGNHHEQLDQRKAPLWQKPLARFGSVLRPGAGYRVASCSLGRREEFHGSTFRMTGLIALVDPAFAFRLSCGLESISAAHRDYTGNSILPGLWKQPLADVTTTKAFVKRNHMIRMMRAGGRGKVGAGRGGCVGIALFLLVTAGVRIRAADPLPSWNEGSAKQAILMFVERVTKPGSPDLVPAAERVATFDNDGTLWVEQPVYTQVFFALDRVKALAPMHPEWRRRNPFRSLLTTPRDQMVAVTEQELLEILMVTHTGITTTEFEETVRDWIGKARHPRFQRLYTECVYQPMLELLAYLRANGFKTFIASGGGVEFMRPWTESTYGIPPENVVGSSVKTKFEIRDGKPVLVRLPEVNFIDDKDGKPVGIHRYIGRRPIAAFGNSDGDLQMLQWTTGAPGARFGMIIHHTDAAREYAYDRNSKVGRLDKALGEATARGWTVVSMKDDWKTVFSWETSK
jgi:hypothetical protein